MKNIKNIKINTPPIILASGSASRKQQLEDLGFKAKEVYLGNTARTEDIRKNKKTTKNFNKSDPYIFTVKVSGINEDFYKKQKKPVSLAEVCQKIAQAKVEKVAKEYPDALVLGGDQMAVLGSKIFNKSATPEQAIKSLMQLQGKTHILFTALYMRYQKKTFNYLEVNQMQMRKLTRSQIKQYVKMAKPLHCAGSYALERYGIALFEKIKTKDQSAVIGFPLITLINQLIKWGIALPFLTEQKQPK
ncbi:MAG: Maf family protein [Bdellovibrionales bacterium]|nr:Maf family protein [Bdellovibrionales bacterium]